MSAHISSPSAVGDGTWTTANNLLAQAPSSVASHDGATIRSYTPSDGGQVEASSVARPGRPAARRHERTNTVLNINDRDRDKEDERETDKDKDKEVKPLVRTSSSNVHSSNVGLDPLSTQIYLRTTSNTEQPSIAQRLRNTGRPDSPTPDASSRQSADYVGRLPNIGDPLKDRRKGPSFLSRLSMRGAFRRDDDVLDSDSEVGELRTEGSSARALTSHIADGDGGGFVPFYKEPPRYIRVRAHNKKTRDFNRLFLAQELLGARSSIDEPPQPRAPQTAVGKKLLKNGDAIWAAEFSRDGKYLAVAGKDQIVRVFAVISTPEERKAHETEEALNGAAGERLSAPVFRSEPVHEFEGHTGEVLALSWSKNNFLLSSSMDKTVRLWHMSRADCLCTYKHSDLVTSICFHPTDDRFFLAGSLDAQLRLWSIPDKAVAYSAATTDLITAVGFSPDGKTAICGLLTGLCLFFETDGLKSLFQIHVRSSRGKNAKGSKITGIRTAMVPPEAEDGQVKVLITSNDSRVRVYNLKTRMLEIKFKGLENQSSQINARFSDDGKYVICGSEDRKAYIWGLDHPEAELKDKQIYECFDAHPEVVTTALMAPVKSRQLLSGSEDPIYELCNPPPVMLRSLDEATASQSVLSDPESQPRRESPTPSGRKPEQSPAYLERCKHLDGNIIVTTDRTGTIKVFRQDCAFNKRQQNLWETASKFSGRVASIGRSGSIITKASGGSRVASRRGSLNMGPNSQQDSDRIMSWRQGIEGGRASLGGGTPTRSERSLSPSKVSRTPLNNSAANLASDARKQPYMTSPSSRPSSIVTPRSGDGRGSVRVTKPTDDNQRPSLPPTPSFSLVSAASPEQPEEKAEGGFWNFGRWRGGIPGLRLSTPSSPPIKEASGSHGSSDQNGGGPQQADPSSPGEKRAGRRSMGVGELNKLKITPDVNRRKSLGLYLPSRSAPTALRSESYDEDSEPDSPGDATPMPLDSKERTGSGIRRMSTESTVEDHGKAS